LTSGKGAWNSGDIPHNTSEADPNLDCIFLFATLGVLSNINFSFGELVVTVGNDAVIAYVEINPATEEMVEMRNTSMESFETSNYDFSKNFSPVPPNFPSKVDQCSGFRGQHTGSFEEQNFSKRRNFAICCFQT